MIKMPLNLDPRQGADWHSTLDVGVSRLQEVQSAAETYSADGGDYIRPIMLVQVERTGDDQREGGFIHALDVMERNKHGLRRHPMVWNIEKPKARRVYESAAPQRGEV
jgi:hypothetical protein